MVHRIRKKIKPKEKIITFAKVLEMREKGYKLRKEDGDYYWVKEE